jgi:hypothetical protein
LRYHWLEKEEVANFIREESLYIGKNNIHDRENNLERVIKKASMLYTSNFDNDLGTKVIEANGKVFGEIIVL